MRYSLLILSLVVSLQGFISEAHAQPTRMTNPNTLAVEALGRGGLYSVQFDRVVADDLSAGFGYGSLSTGIVSIPLLPLFMIYYFNRDARSVFVTGGASVVLSGPVASGLTSSLGGFSIPTSGIIPNAGLGYESRGDSGFLFRIAAYALVTTSVSPWAGFTFGYSF